MLMPLSNSEWGALSRPLMHDSEVDYDPDVPIEPEERPVMRISETSLQQFSAAQPRRVRLRLPRKPRGPACRRVAVKFAVGDGGPLGAPAAAPAASVDVAAVLDALAKKNKQKLKWRTSIVDLMKLLDLDSSHAARKKLAGELNYSGDTDDSAKMNVWLHKQVMIKLAANGGKVPEELKH